MKHNKNVIFINNLITFGIRRFLEIGMYNEYAVKYGAMFLFCLVSTIIFIKKKIVFGNH